MQEVIREPAHEPDYHVLAGQNYVFSDGVIIRIVQVKQRHDGKYVMYENDYGNSLPRRFLLRADLFVEEFGHLFNFKTGQLPND
jgi:hypothetical protein